jgi:hypothetical protein
MRCAGSTLHYRLVLSTMFRKALRKLHANLQKNNGGIFSQPFPNVWVQERSAYFPSSLLAPPRALQAVSRYIFSWC